MDEKLFLELQNKIDRQSGEPIYRQLCDAILGLISAQKIKAEQNLPPVRTLALKLGINTGTVVNAYKLLESKKAVYSVAGSGTYVSEIKEQSQIAETNYKPKSIVMAEAALGSGGVINFANATTSENLFPVKQFKTLFNFVLERDMGNAFGYEDSQGYMPLREALCSYLSGFSVSASADKVQIISGAQQGIDIISKAVLSSGDCVIAETPTYYGAVGSFVSRGATVVGAPIEDDGMDISKLEALLKVYRPKLLYVMPYFQTPTCVSYSIQKKRALLELAAQYDFYIVEEDNQSDFNYDDTLVVPIKSLDYKNRVIYIKSFSKILMPGLRLGFMVLPKAVLTRVISAKYTADVETSGFIQRAFELFIRNGEWEKHVSKMHAIYKKRYMTMLNCSNRYLKGKLSFSAPNGGLNFWYRLPQSIDVAEFCNALIKENVVVMPGDLFLLNNEKSQNIRLSYANLETAQIEEGIKKISLVLDKYMLK